ncbi:glyoxalase/bleomycin resistance protein/dioxygenase superfamily protein [Breznakia blatticola]|uniref:Glyoxalase/bleomycin resistance protein/dioxygenase superfamily protein n=1 Tax=Breznakia blatticola TaxID=1754012 RepID=A0A4R8A6T7_9FIRM|nr:VOC family protein [Breznakia blatticola]TDW26376.1 glyoxalase/bleomycin resistance protein/dioxygenase superfamily protein [Breznakia blatticola]
MITGYYCTNIFSKQAKELIEFYRYILEIPFIKTDVDDSNGVYLGFIEKAPTLCIWDCEVFDTQPTGYQSFVFQTENLDSTMKHLKKNGVSMSEAIRYDWGTYEVRLNDIDGNEIVIVEIA